MLKASLKCCPLLFGQRACGTCLAADSRVKPETRAGESRAPVVSAGPLLGTCPGRVTGTRGLVPWVLTSEITLKHEAQKRVRGIRLTCFGQDGMFEYCILYGENVIKSVYRIRERHIVNGGAGVRTSGKPRSEPRVAAPQGRFGQFDVN